MAPGFGDVFGAVFGGVFVVQFFLSLWVLPYNLVYFFCSRYSSDFSIINDATRYFSKMFVKYVKTHFHMILQL